MKTAATKLNKLRGGYYTPVAVAQWLAAWAVRSPNDRVLEPSCGDGAFVAAAAKALSSYRTLWSDESPRIVGVELVPDEARKVKERLAHTIISDQVQIVDGDFFEWFDSAEPNGFDAVLGNPPFIRYQNFPEPSRTKAMRVMQSQGLEPNRLTNIWVPFVVAGVALLKAGGRLAMVLPAELLQVTYAAQLRRYLTDAFTRLTIYTCNEIFFDNAQQEVVLLLADNKVPSPNSHHRCTVSFVETGSVAELVAQEPKSRRGRPSAKQVQHDTEKWLKYFLDSREIEFMRALRSNPAVGFLSEHAEIDVGVVTGRNEFFVLSSEQVELHGLGDFVTPLVGRSAQLPGVVLRKREHGDLARAGNRVYLLNTGNRDLNDLPVGLREFIAWGEQCGFHRGYKCSVRNPWYQVPAAWEPDCFFFRQIYDFPRAVVNKANATSTDTIHRMRCSGPAARVAANLYTHLTAASAEIEGRSYGGGVLELEPTEAERLLVPKVLNSAMPIEDADRLVRAGRLADVLEENDRVVLQGSMGLSGTDCDTLKTVWAKMRDRRISRRRR